jgi:hypothetical protein
MAARGCPRCRGTDCLRRGGLPRRRGAYLRPDLREDLDSYLLARTWALYLKFDPAKASTPLSLSTYLTRRLNFAISDWFRSTFSDRRYNSRCVVKEVSSLDVELEQEHDLPAEDDSVSILPSLSDTGRGRWERFGFLHAAGFTFKEISQDVEALQHELRSLRS